MKRFRDTVWLLFRLGLAVGVMAWLLKKMGLDQMGQALRDSAGHWPWLLAAFLVTLPSLLLCMLRWKMILDAQGMRMPWGRVNSIFFIGLFFNSFMIGPTGGDVVKAYYTARETHHKKTEAVASIFIDRVIGLLTLAILAAGMILARWGMLMASPTVRTTALATFIVCAVVIIGSVLAFSVHLFEAIPLLKRATGHAVVGRLFRIMEKTYNAFYICRSHPRLFFNIGVCSFVLQILAIAVGALIGRALDLDLPFTDYLTFAPIVGLISAIPITPGGSGIREGASVHLWAIQGVPAAKAFLLGFLPYVMLVLWGLPGGIFFLFHRAGAAEALKADSAEDGDEPT